ncbi:MAG: alpha/beta hydrolase, partial [Myxococcota bacterium]
MADETVTLQVFNASSLKALGKASLRSEEEGLLVVGASIGDPSDPVLFYGRLGPLAYIFEGIVVAQQTVMRPDRLFYNEKRGELRRATDNLSVLYDRTGDLGPLTLPVLEESNEGAALLLPEGFALPVGSTLPVGTAYSAGETRGPWPRCEVRNVSRRDDGRVRVGVRFSKSTVSGRDVAANIQSVRTDLRVANRLSEHTVLGQPVTFYNSNKEVLVGLLDSTELDNEAQSELGVILCSPFQKRKEVLSALAATLLVNANARHNSVRILRYDATRSVGESYKSPDSVAQDSPALDHTFSSELNDLRASVRFLDKLGCKRIALVTPSILALAGRKLLLEEDTKAAVWVAPFGCPDAREPLRNAAAGLDVFELAEQGQKLGRQHLLGAYLDADAVVRDAQELAVVSLEQGRADLSKIDVPTVWIAGEYDGFVSPAHVQSFFEVEGGGIRELFVLPTGHVATSGAEAIEVARLVTESVFKHAFGADLAA